MKHLSVTAGVISALLAIPAAFGFDPAQTAAAPPAPAHVLKIGVTTGSSFLGVGLEEIDAERAKALKLPEEQGVEVTRVEDDSPAAKAGLKTGDVILEYNGQRLEGTEQLGRMVRETPSGRLVKVLISRNGARQTLVVTIRTRHARVYRSNDNEFEFTMPHIEIPDIELPEIVIPDMPHGFNAWKSSALGVSAEGIESQLAQYFGVKEGVLIRSVNKGSAAEKAGIKAGDVVVKVDGEAVSNTRDMSRALRAARSKHSYLVALVRDHKEVSVSITWSEDHSEISLRRPVRL